MLECSKQDATTCGYMWILYSYSQVCGNQSLFIEEHTYSISSNYHLEICVETCGNTVAWALIIRHFCRPGKMQRKNSFLRQNKLVKLLKPKVQIKMLGQPVESRQESGHIFFWYYTNYILWAGGRWTLRAVGSFFFDGVIGMFICTHVACMYVMFVCVHVSCIDE